MPYQRPTKFRPEEQAVMLKLTAKWQSALDMQVSENPLIRLAKHKFIETRTRKVCGVNVRQFKLQQVQP